MFVERIDQRDEPRRLVAVFGAELGDADDEDAVIAPRDCQIVGRAPRLRTQSLEREDCNALQAFGHVELPPAANIDIFGRDVRGIFRRIIGQLEERVAHRSRRDRAIGHMPGRDAGQPLHPVIGRAVEWHHVEAALDQCDERQEMFAVEAILVKLIGRSVGGGDQCHTGIDQPRKQSRHNHRVG